MIVRSGLEKDLLNICEKFNNIPSKLALSEFEENLYYLDIKFNKYSNKTRIRFSIQITENDEIQLQMLIDEQDERFLNKNDSEEKLFRDSKGFSIRSSFVPEIYHFESNCINLMGSREKLISNQYTYYCFRFLIYIERVLFCLNEWTVSEHFNPIKSEAIAGTLAFKIENVKNDPTLNLVMRLNLYLESLKDLEKRNLELHNIIVNKITDKIEFYKQEYQMLENIKKDIDNKKY